MPRLIPLFSGSSGNCYYIGSSGGGVLIDAGRSARQIENALKSYEIDINSIKAVFVTHEHSDHISGLRVLSSKHKLKIFASPGTVRELLLREAEGAYENISVLEMRGTELDNMKVVPFHTSHDCAEGYGFIVETGDGRKTVFATDTGCVTDEMQKALKCCDTAVIESNHDVGMLETGFYPYVLKKRILSDKGHLSNDVCADVVAGLVKSGSTRFLLAHLSKENNMPLIAEQTTVGMLSGCGMKRNVDYQLMVLGEKDNPSIIY